MATSHVLIEIKGYVGIMWSLFSPLLDEYLFHKWHYMVCFVLNNGKQKEMCYNEIGLCAVRIY